MDVERSTTPFPVFSLLQEAVQMYVRNAPRLLGITALLQLPLIIFEICLRLVIITPGLQSMRELISSPQSGVASQATLIDSLARTAASYFGGALILFIVQSLFVQPVLTCVLTHATQQVIKGQQLTVRGAYQLPIRIYRDTVVANSITYALTVLPVALLLTFMLWFLWRAQTTLPNINGSQNWTIVIVLLVALFPTLLLCIYLSVRLQLTPQAIVFDGINPFQGIKRTWQVTKGLFWRLLGAIFLVGVLMSAIAGVPDSLAQALVFAATVGMPAHLAIAQIVSAIISGIGQGVWISMQVVLYSFFYHHLRSYSPYTEE